MTEALSSIRYASAKALSTGTNALENMRAVFENTFDAEGEMIDTRELYVQFHFPTAILPVAD
ncbi:hypothetical protein GCM10023184_23420 [Flaviaesturariibacter amylovorans]|uniref:Uncharacterized protein n=1 Tax=Flaviaesturariibacter amylovorans TaxID=1084520 RepID=A0ABP8GXV7_9BACT